ncbi:hypothetical protein GCQ56_07775 [Marinifilum sp. N1E240]|uniref:hypothetical protein n=1 Tax=Marinifilum sp. N1E240 TaxID=2608082 RepID=UPI00128D55CD|nr:hypothetical protein [Marinifilum sp. N1E240]MPQ46912.1 hypothetical protein [Marinifilum sp. N1E240]
MWSERRLLIGLLTFLSLLFLGIFVIVLNGNVTITGDELIGKTTIFNNILTPIVTLAAFIVYYVTLKYIMKQTKQQKEDSKILQGDYFLKYYNKEIKKLKNSVSNENIAFNLEEYIEEEDIIKTEDISVLSLVDYMFILLRIKDKFINNAEYLNLIETKSKINFNDSKDKEWFIHYSNLFLFYTRLYSQLRKITLLVSKIDTDSYVHESHKKILIENIFNSLLYDYCVMNALFGFENFQLIDFNDRSLEHQYINSHLEGFRQGISIVEYYKLDELYKWLELNNPDLYDEITFTNARSVNLFEKIRK